MDKELQVHPPFSLSPIIRSHGWIQLEPFRSDENYSMFSYVDRLDSGKIVEVIVREISDGVSIQAEVASSTTEQNEISQKVSWMLGLDQTYPQFYELIQQEPKLAHVSKEARGRILRSPTLFEDIVKTILTTNTAWSGTKRMVKNLVTLYGDALTDEPERYAFPTPSQLAATSEEALRSDARLGYRSPYVLDLARQVSSGALDIESLKAKSMPTQELRKNLLNIKGVGDYAAANLLMLLGCYDYLPVDSWAKMMVSHEWYDGEPVGREEVESAFESWGEWKGLAFWFWDWSYQKD